MAVDLQTDLIGLNATRIMAPMRPAGQYTAFPNITPLIDHDAEEWVLRLQEMAAVPASEIDAVVGKATRWRDEIKRGIDVLIDGF